MEFLVFGVPARPHRCLCRHTSPAGSGTGAGRLTEDVVQVLSQLGPIMKQVSGVDMDRLLRDIARLPGFGGRRHIRRRQRKGVDVVRLLGRLAHRRDRRYCLRGLFRGGRFTADERQLIRELLLESAPA